MSAFVFLFLQMHKLNFSSMFLVKIERKIYLTFRLAQI